MEEREKQHIKEQLENYLTLKGKNAGKPFNCLNPEHNDKKPSMSYDRNKERVHCFSCGVSYDLFDLIGIEYNLTGPAEIFKKAEELYLNKTETPAQNKKNTTQEAVNTQQAQSTQPAQKEDFTSFMESCSKRIKDTDYFKKRGLSEKIIERFKLGYDPEFKTKENEKYILWQAAIIPTGNTSYTARNINSKDNADKVRKRGESQIYNPKALYTDKPLFIVEGEIDALSVIEAGAEAIALGSTANINKLIKIIEKKRPTNTLILSLDNDAAGETAKEKLQTELEKLNISFITQNIAGNNKDPNEALIADKELFIKRVQEAQEAVNTQQAQEKEEYLKTSTAYYLQNFINGIKDSVNTPYISTGFSTLDGVLDGGLYEGLYVIGAISSLGKTTYILQIADQIAQQKQDILIFSLEMARAELMAKSISRLTFEIGQDSRNAKTTRGITTGKRYDHYSPAEKELIKTSIQKYKEYANNIYISEGMGDIGSKQIRETVNKHITITGNKPVIIIDYLQLLAPADVRSTDKQNIDKSVMELKRISRDFKIPVIAISSFNRQSYNSKVTMEAFKESGAIEYSSDILIGMQAKGIGDNDIDRAKQKNPREIEVKILKNRNGATGNTLNYEYYPLFNFFKESGA